MAFEKKICGLTLIFLFSICVVSAQTQGPETHSPTCLQDRLRCAYQKPLQRLAVAYSKAATTDAEKNEQSDALQEVVTFVAPEHFVLALTGQNLDDALLGNVVNAWERARVDKQVGTTSASKGTTDLVSRPSTSELLGMAVQAGAMTETVSGSVATFQVNAEGAYRALLEQPVICQDCLKTWSLNNLNMYISFDLTGQGTKNVSTTGSASSSFQAPSMVMLPETSKEFSALDVKYNLRNPIDPRSKKFKDAWTTSYKKYMSSLQAEGKTLDAALAEILAPIDKDSNVLKLETDYRPKFRQAAATAKTGDDLYPLLQEYFTKLQALAQADVPDLNRKVSAAVASYARYSQINYDAVSEAAGSQLTAEYTYNHPKTQPDTHDFRFIYSLTPKHDPNQKGTLFTINVDGSIYGGEIPAGSKYGRMRDFQFAAQFDHPLGDVITHPATFTLAGYVQYQFDPSVLNIGSGNLVPGTSITLPSNAQVLLGTKGTLGIVQAKITVNTKTGINIPIGVSWANKTDLLNATDVRGNVGITYDFNSLSQLFGH
jgi:hypothetical protein